MLGADKLRKFCQKMAVLVMYHNMAVGLLIGRHVSVSVVVVPTSQAVDVMRKLDS